MYILCAYVYLYAFFLIYVDCLQMYLLGVFNLDKAKSLTNP